MDLIDAARELIAIDTSPDSGTREVAQWLKTKAEQLNLDFLDQEDSFNGVEQSNVMISVKDLLQDESKFNEDFLLVSHLDTVDPGSGLLWTENQFNPFNLIIKDGYLHGLGVADGKLDFLCKLEALSQWQNSEYQDRSTKLIRRPVLLGTYGEEIGMHGMLRYIRKNKNKNKAKYALIGETTDLNIIHGTKGYAVIEIKIPFSKEEQAYRSQHDLSESATTQTRIFNATNLKEKGGYWSTKENAIDKIFKYLLQIPEGIVLMEVDAGVSHNVFPLHGMVEFDVVSGIQNTMAQKLKQLYYSLTELRGQFLRFNDAEFSPSQPQLNISTIKTVEGELYLTAMFLFPPLVTEIDYQNWLNQIKDYVQLNLNGDIRLVDYKKPYKISKDSDFIKKCLELSKENNLSCDLITLPKTNESSLLSRIGVECISFGAGIREGNTHSPSEMVKISDLNLSVEFYKKALSKFCIGE